MNKKFLVLFAIVFSALFASAQSSIADSLLYDYMFSEKEPAKHIEGIKNYHFLYLRSNFNSNTFYAGREIGSDQYNLSGQLSYFNTNGLYAGVAGAWYSQIDPNYSTTVASIGYGKSLTKFKNLRLRASYDHYFYNVDIPDFEPSYFGAASIGASVRSKYVGARTNVAFLVGNEFGMQGTVSAYSKFTLLKLNKFDKLQIRPEISMQFGSENVEYASNTTLIPDEFLIPDIYTREEYGLLNTKVELPISLSYKDFDIEFAYIANIPHSLDANYSYPITTYFSVSVGYFFSLNK